MIKCTGKKWVDITMEVRWKLRKDQIFTMWHNGEFFGIRHPWGEFWVGLANKFKTETKGYNFKIFKKELIND